MDDNKSEKEIQNEIMHLLYQLGIFCWPQNNTGVWDQKKGVYRKNNSKFHMNGVPDIIGHIPYYSPDDMKPMARALYIEVKSKTGTLRPEQRVFLARALDAGAIAFVARSTQDVIKNLMKHIPEHGRIKQFAKEFKVPLEH